MSGHHEFQSKEVQVFYYNDILENLAEVVLVNKPMYGTPLFSRIFKEL